MECQQAHRREAASQHQSDALRALLARSRHEARRPALRHTPLNRHDDRRRPLILLHLGSSTLGRLDTPQLFHGDEWTHVRVDSDPNTKPDVITNMVTLEGVNTHADAIYASHSFEHLHPFDADRALETWRKVLVPSGLVVLHIPDLESAADAIVKGFADTPLYVSDAGPITPLDIIFGFRSFTETPEPGMRHAWGYTKDSLSKKLAEHGFAGVNVYRDRARFEVRAYCRT